ncbi:MAG: phosphonate metabolism protein/1,5-bisphosphokinase (PRPP-forming) PhnN [Promethearchaeota archaeon]
MLIKKKRFSGTLFLVVGNSGSGKDSIIYGVAKKYPQNLKQIQIVKRYITRPPSETEDNYSITPNEFKEMEQQGKFALKWHIYHLDYGVPIEIDEWLNKGHPVLVNVSRTIVAEAREKYDNIKVVFIEVPFEITLKRVKDRRRETGDLLNERLERARTHQNFSSADFVVDNSGDLDTAIDQFLNYILKIVNK